MVNELLHSVCSNDTCHHLNHSGKEAQLKYHIVSTSTKGHGAIFTNLKDAQDYMKKKPGAAYAVSDQMPERIAPKSTKTVAAKSKVIAKNGTSEIVIYTDGSALNNPGPGGYGVVLMMDGDTGELSQGYKHTTNNRMEMLAVITALEEIDSTDRPVKIFSDSQYTINGVTKGWARSWKKRGWKKADGKPALNSDLWKSMLEVTKGFPNLTFQWVRGHAGDPGNERADELANGAAHGGGLLDDVGYSG